MQRYKSILLISVGAFVIFTVLTELSVISYDGRQRITCKRDGNWNFRSLETEATPSLFSNNECRSAKRFDNIPVRVTYGSAYYGDSISCRTIIVKLDDLAIDVIWSPWINSADFSLTQSISYGCKVFNEAEQKILMLGADGKIKLNGSLELSGIYSNSEARRYIEDYVMKVIYKEVKRQLKEQQQDRVG